MVPFSKPIVYQFNVGGKKSTVSISRVDNHNERLGKSQNIPARLGKSLLEPGLRVTRVTGSAILIGSGRVRSRVNVTDPVSD